MKLHVKLLLHEQSLAVFPNVFNEHPALWLIAERSILKHKQTGTEKSDYNVFSIVTHCGSCPLANKSPLSPSIQGLGAASHRQCLHLCKLPDHRPPQPEAAHLLNSFLHLLSIERHRHPTALPLLSLHSCWTHLCISFVLAMVPASLYAFLGTVIKNDLKPHLCVM